MSQRVVLATFRDEDDLRGAARQARAAGAKILDVFSPYAVHGLDEDLGWQPSRLTWACALCGGAGALFMLWFQMWTSAVDWPVNVGGKPYNSLPAYVPVIFEAMVLCGAVGTVLAFLIVARLMPGRRRALIRPGVTDDRFALLIEQTDATFDVPRITSLLATHHAEQIEQQVIDVSPSRDDAQDEDGRRWLNWLNVGLAAVVVLLALAILIVPRDGSRPNFEFMPTMRRSVPLDPQAALAGIPAAEPLPGTLSRDARPLHYAAGEQESKRAAAELVSPLAADDPADLERGREVFFQFCAACHGASGDGDGPMIVRGYPPPPPLSAEKSRLTKDGELFHVITFGRNNMPSAQNQLSQPDRWRVLLYIRQLQRKAVADAERAAAAVEESSQPVPETPAPSESDSSNNSKLPAHK